eukprot:6196619-Pleurochrysis_carterae.AAC.3
MAFVDVDEFITMPNRAAHAKAPASLQSFLEKMLPTSKSKIGGIILWSEVMLPTSLEATQRPPEGVPLLSYARVKCDCMQCALTCPCLCPYVMQAKVSQPRQTGRPFISE